jgi:hypothetical protein
MNRIYWQKDVWQKNGTRPVGRDVLIAPQQVSMAEKCVGRKIKTGGREFGKKIIGKKIRP